MKTYWQSINLGLSLEMLWSEVDERHSHTNYNSSTLNQTVLKFTWAHTAGLQCTLTHSWRASSVYVSWYSASNLGNLMNEDPDQVACPGSAASPSLCSLSLKKLLCTSMAFCRRAMFTPSTQFSTRARTNIPTPVRQDDTFKGRWKRQRVLDIFK